MAHLDIRLLGPFQVLIGGESAAGFDSDKVRALLAYLAVEADRPVRREKLAGLLWPDFSESSARTNLRQALANLRRVLGDQDAEPRFLLPTHQDISFNRNSDHILDVRTFLALTTGEPGRGPSVQDLERAVALYQGEFLQGFSLPDAGTFEEWALVTRESLQRQALGAMRQLADFYEEQAAHERALDFAYRQLGLDPYREPAHQQVLRLLALSGQRNEAIAHYESYRQLLETELDVAPLQEMQALYDQIQAGDLAGLAATGVREPRTVGAYRGRLKGERLPFPVPPGGTVTFLFTDIAGATGLLRGLGKRYRTLLADQRQILREAFARWNGYEVDTQGDAFFFAFPRATEAVAAAVEAQRGLAAHAWPEGEEVRVRMGLHTGEPWLADEGYIGIDVHRAARIAQIGHGGQVLLSETTAALVVGELPDKVRLQDLGRHVLKDMPRPERIRQLSIQELPEEFPPLDSLEVLPPEQVLPLKAGRMPSFLAEAEEEESRSPFVGRARQIARLDALLDRALSGKGGFGFVTGGPGRGKTALLKAFASRALSDHPDLLVSGGECNTFTSVGDPYLPFRQTLNLLCGDLEPRWKEKALTREQARRLWEAFPLAAHTLIEHGQDLVDVFVSGERLLTRAAMTVPADSGLLQAIKHLARREPGTGGRLEQKALHEQYTHFLTALAERKPVLVLLDDLQWADEASISLLFHLGRRLAAGPILILGAYRPDEVTSGRSGRRRSLERLLAEFKAHYGDIWIDLSRTEAAEDRQFVRAFLDSTPNRFSSAFRESFYRHTAGHPLFSVELWRDLEARAGIVRDAKGSWIEGPELSWDTLPVRVEGVIEERLGRLDKDLRELLTVAAVEGEQFTAQVLARVLSQNEQRVIDMLVDDLGANQKLVVEQGPHSVQGQRIYRFRFSHMLYSQYLYANLSPIKRERLHHEVGAALEALYQKDLEDIAPRLVWHFDQIKDEHRVMRYAFLAGERARRLGASSEAIYFYKLALERAGGMEPGDAPVEPRLILERLGDVYLQNLSRHAEALTHYREFLDLAEPGEEKIRAQRKIADVYLLDGEFERAQEFYTAALDRLDAEAPIPEGSLIHASLAYLAIFRNDMDAAEAAAQTALDIATRLDFSPGEAQAHNALGHVDTYRGALEDAQAHFESSLAIYRQQEDLPRLAKMYNNLGEITRLLGKMDAAHDYLQEGLSIARRLGDKREEAALLTTSGDTLLDQGHWEEAAALLEETLPIAEESGVTERRIEAQWFLGAAYLRLGRFEQARACLMEVEKRCIETNYVRYLPNIYFELARLEIDVGDDRASNHYLQLASSAVGDEPADEVLGEIQHLHGYLYASQKEWDRAIAHYQQALERLEAANSPVKTAEVRMALGLAYSGRARPGDGQRERENLTAAYELYQKIDAQPHLAAIQGHLEEE